MQPAGKLDVRVNRRRNQARNSLAPSENSVSNQFVNSHFSQSEHQSSMLDTHSPAPSPRIESKEKAFVSKGKQPVREEKNDKNSNRRNVDLGVIREQNLNLAKGKEKNEKAKKNSFIFQQSPRVEQRKKLPQFKPIVIESEPENVSEEEDPSVTENVQVKKMKDLNAGMSKLNENLMDLKENYNELQKKEQEVKKRRSRVEEKEEIFGMKLSPAKQKQVQEFLTIKQKEAKARRRLLKQIAEKERYQMDLEFKQQEMLRERDRKRRLKQLKRYSKFDQKHELMKENEEEKIKMAQQVVRKYEGRQAYHIRQQKEDQERQRRRQEKEKELLTERREMFRFLDVSDFQQHRKWHDDKIYELAVERNNAKEEEAQRIAEENQAMNDIWRGQVHGVVEEELMQRRRKKREPKQKAKKMRVYRQYVKQHFLPKTYQPKSIQKSRVRKDTSMSHREVKRYRYYKGVAYGEVVETQPQAKSLVEQKKMGDNYLQFVKSLPKRRAVSPSDELYLDPEEIAMLEKKFNTIARVERNAPQPIYDDLKKKKAQIQVSQDVKRDELQMIVLQLKAKEDRLRKKQTLLNNQQHGGIENVQGVQRSINQGLVDNMERKLSLLAQL